MKQAGYAHEWNMNFLEKKKTLLLWDHTRGFFSRAMWPGAFPNPGYFSEESTDFYHWPLLSVIWDHELWAHMTPLGNWTSNSPTHTNQQPQTQRCRWNGIHRVFLPKTWRSFLYVGAEKYQGLKFSLVSTFLRALQTQSSYSSRCLVLSLTEPERETIPAHVAQGAAPKGKEPARHQLTAVPLPPKCQPAAPPK